MRVVSANMAAGHERGGLRCALSGMVVDHLSVSRVDAGLKVSWNTANTAVLAEGRRVLIR